VRVVYRYVKDFWFIHSINWASRSATWSLTKFCRTPIIYVRLNSSLKAGVRRSAAASDYAASLIAEFDRRKFKRHSNSIVIDIAIFAHKNVHT
jgi:hypothetical protein